MPSTSQVKLPLPTSFTAAQPSSDAIRSYDTETIRLERGRGRESERAIEKRHLPNTLLRDKVGYPLRAADKLSGRALRLGSDPVAQMRDRACGGYADEQTRKSRAAFGGGETEKPGKQGNRETGKQGNRETGKQGNGETEKCFAVSLEAAEHQ